MNILGTNLFLYDKVLEKPLGDLGTFRRSSRQRKLPEVLTREEMRALLATLRGPHRLTTLAPELVPFLRKQIERVAGLLEDDRQQTGYAGVWMPDALARMEFAAR